MAESSGSNYFDGAGRFRSVELAALHAIVIQRGFTTEAIEAERMTRSHDPIEAEMGRAWIEAHPDAR